jgi:signal transduction histidine kinase
MYSTLVRRILLLFSFLLIFSQYHSAFADQVHREASIGFTEEELKFIQQKKILRMCIDPNWMPYERMDPDAGYIGIGADVHAKISELTGLKYEIVDTKSWPETLKKAKAGECDILSILNETQERHTYLDFTTEYIKSPSVFVTRDRDKFINGVTDLLGETLSIVEGYKIDEMIRDKYPEIKRIHVNNIGEALDMVHKGEAFSTAGSLLEISYTIRQSGLLDLKITGDAKFDYELRVGVRKGDKLLLSVMNKAVEYIKIAEMDAILSKWVSIDYRSSYDYSLMAKMLAGFALVLLLILYRYRITKKYNKTLINLNNDLNDAKFDLENVNRGLEDKVRLETAKRVENERILMQQSKMAAMGDMMGAIAHQWRQPLNALGIAVQDIEDCYDMGTVDEKEIRNTIAISMRMINQMSDTIDDFSNFFMPDKSEEVFELCSVVSEVAMMFRPQLISKGIQLSFESSGNVLEGSVNDFEKIKCMEDIYTKGFPNEFRHVVLNIIKNAMDSIEEKAEPDDNCISISLAEENDDLLLSIKDTGIGIPDELGERIFEPYFSTKEEGKGVGIGLYMSKQIIENMKGKIYMENCENGAKFTIRLRSVKPD